MILRSLLVAVLLAVACGPTPATATPIGSAAASVTTSIAAQASSTAYVPRLLLSVPYAVSTDAVGATTARVGGVSPVGVGSFAVDERERVYLWDQARLRVVIYDAGSAS